MKKLKFKWALMMFNPKTILSSSEIRPSPTASWPTAIKTYRLNSTSDKTSPQINPNIYSRFTKSTCRTSTVPKLPNNNSKELIMVEASVTN